MPKPMGGRRGTPVDFKNMPKIKKGTFKRLVKFLFEDYKKQIILILICLAVASASNAMPSIFLKNITDIIMKGLSLGSWDAVRLEVISLIAVMALILFVGVAANTVQSQVMAIVTQGFLNKMRKRMFNEMQELPIKYFDTHGHGDIMSYYTNDIDTLRQLVSQSLPMFFQSGILLICLVGVMMHYSLNLMIVLVLGVVLMTLATKYIGGASARYFMKQQKGIGGLESFIEEHMNGQKVVKVFCHEELSEADFDKLNNQYCEDARKASTYGNIMGPVMNNIGNLLYVLIAFAGGLMIVAGAKNYSLGGLLKGSFGSILPISVVVSFLNIGRQFTNNVNQIAQQFSTIALALAGADRVFSLMDEPEEEDNGYVTLVNAVEAPDGSLTETAERTGIWAWRHPHTDGSGVTYTKVCGDVRMFNVDFSYVEGKEVLHDISLWAEPGQKIAFVGATGAGKTTITNLINRFYDIADGKIRYDGININKIKKPDLRKSLGVVLQDVNLFTGTVMDNIRYGKLDATDEECIAAAKLANAHDFISRLPDGYNTMLTSNGANLSQGQRQLISIARAAVADPPVMILDEATSSIDTRTEALVQKGMDGLMQGRTVFVIAHRLSTVRNADAIMVLDHGRIIERGSHDDLVAQKGEYYRLYTGAFELE